MDPGKLFEDAAFPTVDRAQWAAAAARAARGAELEARTDDGLVVDPLSPRVAEPHRLARVSPDRGWAIVQRCDDVDTARAHAQAQDDVANGATGIALVFEGAPNAFGYGLPDDPSSFAEVLDGIPLDKVHLRCDPHPSSRAMAEHLVAYLSRLKDPSRLSVSFGIDSAAVFAGTGRLRMSLEALQASLPQSIAHFFAMGLPGVILEADGRVFHNAGATEAQELGAILAGGVAHLRLFAEARQALIYAVRHVGFALAVDQDQFLSMAKIRALRLLWARALEAAEVEPNPARIHAETSYRMMTAADPETNILRTTLAAFAAGAGGADSVSVLPHTIAHGLPAGFARRIARNAQLILQKESRIDFVSDPASGAGSIEALTQSLCEAAWPEFQRIEAEGGLLQSLASGRLQARIRAAAAQRAEAFAAGRRTIVGTTAYRGAEGSPTETLSAQRRPGPTDGIVFCDRLDPARLDQSAGAPH